MRGSAQAQRLAECIRAVAAQKSVDCYRVLFEHYYPRLVTFFRRAGMPTVSAEDSAQEVLLVVWTDAALFDDESKTVGGWVSEIARDLLSKRNAAKLHMDGITVLMSDVPIHQEPAKADGAKAEDTERLYAAMQTLAMRDAELFRGAFVEGLSHAKLAARHNTPLGTIKTRLRKSLVKLQQFMGLGCP